jgi:hypothetical protein
MDFLQRSVVVPALEVVMHGATRGQVLRNIAPTAAGAQDIHNAVEHFSDIDFPASASSFGRRDQRFDLSPLGIGQVAGVTQLVPVVPGTVLSSPHRAPRESMPEVNHRQFNAFKPPVLTDSKDSQSSRTDT